MTDPIKEKIDELFEKLEKQLKIAQMPQEENPELREFIRQKMTSQIRGSLTLIAEAHSEHSDYISSRYTEIETKPQQS